MPHLKFDLFASELDRLDLEVDADGRNEGGVESVIREPEEDASLADAGVADEEKLEQEVVAFLGHLVTGMNSAGPDNLVGSSNSWEDRKTMLSLTPWSKRFA